jgi:hypothetical protein
MTTTEILNDSTSVQSRIDTVLATPELDWTNESAWFPGDPLYSSPGCTPRHMFDLIEQWTAPARCEPCQVRWSGDTPCWVCGEPRPHAGLDGARAAWAAASPRRAAASLMVTIDVRPFVEAIERLTRSLASLDLDPFQRYWLNQLVPTAPPADPISCPLPLPIDGRAYRRRSRRRR